MMKHILIFLLLWLHFNSQGQSSADVTFQIKTEVTKTPPSIKLTWKKSNLNVTGYNISRKLRNDNSWTLLATNQPLSDTSFTDNTIAPGVGYEYRVSNPSNVVTGYVYASVELPAQHFQGKIILLVDSNYITTLSNEIKLFEMNLIAEGWILERFNIGRTQSVASVKQLVKSSYQGSPIETKGIIILGHVPIPYSGDLNPDGHPDHRGAWPTDLYYIDTLSNYWTDISVNDTVASRNENKNIPGDGKFDQSNLPQSLMFVSRIDLYNMPIFNVNDTLLMQRYFQKNHEYRTANKTYRMRSIIDDNFGYFSGEAFAQNGFRNFSSLLSPDSVYIGDYFTGMKNDSYLWSYGCGGGWYQGASGIGNTNNFQTDTIQSVFTLLFGSYFGDWDNQNNFLRAPLASPSPTLTNFWAGRPNIFLHLMALGEPIGNSFFTTINNMGLYHPFGAGYKSIHQTLLGDATLKMFPYKGASGLAATTIQGASITSLSWIASFDPQVLGYYIYRTSSLTDSFTVLNSQPILNTNFYDSTAKKGKNIYMVRAVKLQQTASGSFYNLSPGVIDSVQIQTPFGISELQENEIALKVYPIPANKEIIIELDEVNPNIEIQKIRMQDILGKLVLEKKIESIDKISVQLNDIRKGNYLLSIETNHGIIMKKISIE